MKRRYFEVALFAAVSILLLTAAGSAPKKDTDKKDGLISVVCTDQAMNIEEDGFVSATGIRYSFELDRDSAGKYPKLSKVIDEINKKESADFEKNLKKASESAIVRHMDGWDYPYEADDEATVTRADDKAFSYGVSCYSYLGGAHGYLYYSARNIDPVTGDDISFFDVVKDTSGLPQIVVDEIIAQNDHMKEYFDSCPTDKDSLLGRIKDDVKKGGDGPVWSLTYDGVRIYFEDYAMGSYAAGSMVVDIPYKDHPKIYNDRYFTYDGAVPETADSVTARNITDPVTVKDEDSIMEVGLHTVYRFSYDDAYCMGEADELTVPGTYPRLSDRVEDINSGNLKKLDRAFPGFVKEADRAYEDSGRDGSYIRSLYRGA